MANLQRFVPPQDLDDLLNGLVFRPMRIAQAPQIQSIRIDATEDDAAYRISAEIPGVRKEDIEVSVDDNVVTITARARSEQDAREGTRVIYRERSFGAASRSFTLAEPVNEAEAQAKYENGVLELTLPKRSNSRFNRIIVT